MEFLLLFSFSLCKTNSNKLLTRMVFVFGVLVFWIASVKSEFHISKNFKFSALLVFGDSIVDPGNNNAVVNTPSRANYPPYGQDFPGGIPTGRFSNGKNPADILDIWQQKTGLKPETQMLRIQFIKLTAKRLLSAKTLSIKETLPAYLDPNMQPEELLTGVSFASGGCGYDPLSAVLAVATPLSEQLDQFQEYKSKLKSLVGEEKTNDIISRSLVLVVASSNDIANTFFSSGLRNAQYDVNSYTDFIANAAGDFVKDLFVLGATKVAVLSAPPLGCLPSIKTVYGGTERNSVERINHGAQLFNSKLSSAINALNASTPDALAVMFDIYNPLLEIIQNPQRNGFDVADLGCCGTGKIEVTALCSPLNPHLKTCSDPTKYVFWDSFHPTQTTYELLVSRIYKEYFGH